MSQAHTLILGAIAGMTIMLGLPMGRLSRPAPGLRHFLNAVAIGVLLFLFWDVVAHAWEPIDTALSDVHEDTGGMAPVFGYGALFFGGLGIGLISLVYYEAYLARNRARHLVTSSAASSGPNEERPRRGLAEWTPTRRMALMIAVGIGLHNFGEGLAIGGSAARGEISLATLLVIGFALHNATEGFGIVAPMAADGERPSWRFLFVLGLIGGAPTFVGTLVGRQVTNEALSVAFLTLAAGSILYVVIQLLGVASKVNRKDLLVWGVFVGLIAGFVTDMIVTAGGA